LIGVFLGMPRFFLRELRVLRGSFFGKSQGEGYLRLVASVAPWLPWIEGILPNSVLLGGKAAELYYFSILEKPTPALLARETVFAVAKGGKTHKLYHDRLLKQGFQKRWIDPASGTKTKPVYHREDLGFLEFRCAGYPGRKNPYTEGLVAAPGPWVELLLQDPHVVELKYLGKEYSVQIPQTGRFILVHGLGMKTRKKALPGENYRASQNLVLILYLLLRHPELEEEALNDMVDIQPASLIREFQQNLKDNGPDTPVWEGARKFYLELFPDVKAVQLSSWYWKFLARISNVLKEQKDEDRGGR